MSDLQAQLDDLRRKMAAASVRAAEEADAQFAAIKAARIGRIEDHVDGWETENGSGKHFQTHTHWDRFRHHGSMQIGRLEELPAGLLAELIEGAAPEADPTTWAFLDTETTGLAGGSGTAAFLVGIGRLNGNGFRVRQFFMRDFDEESSMLEAIEEELAGAQVLVTYNGRCFDIPLLETRFRLQRRKPPFTRLPHLDLLYSARRLWRLRFDSCRLVELESRILGHERHGDVPGEEIPAIYFDWVKLGRAARLKPVFHHNVLDIVSLACLTAIVPWIFRDGGISRLKHGAEMVSMARWLRNEERTEEARELYRRALRHNMPEDLLHRAMWELAAMEKRARERNAAVALWTDLATLRNPFRAAAFEELAKHYEHAEKNYRMALEMTEAALAIESSPELLHRRGRLERLARCPEPGRLL